MNNQKAIVIGSTGMVGKELVKKLIENEHYSEIISLVRRPSGVTNPKLDEHVIDFDHPETWKELVKGDVLFSTLGTTISKAKSKEEQFKVDFTYQYNVAKIAVENGATSYVLVSSAGANASSKGFYMSMKGKLDEAVQGLPFEYINILRPSQLSGKRTEKRLGEKVGLSVMYGLNIIGLFKRYKPIKDKKVAKAMIHAARKTHSTIYTLDEVHELAKQV
ncbi:MAG TPA: NAD(P)H-binding protein [Paludibacter sp.]|jgi:uncharacterized protein YbjT (DUF2867 family)|nr:NAD(P)H-binding protein [Paludibacter sp.]